ncbi:MAG: phenylalanine--tRNA ligase beta subunit-related protein [Anaerolineae bacterium]|nr:phenylalanine--tRNA ligase beta subunit-related protein [Anaerolineae bacterium]
MPLFQYHPALVAEFPALHAGLLLVQGAQNPPSSAALRARYQAEQQAVLARLGTTPLSDLEPLAAWRAVFRAGGVDPTQYRSAPEALLRRLTKKGDLPCINTLVDAGNLVSIRHALPVAVLDRRAIHGGLTVQRAAGTETFIDLHETETVQPAPGEIIFCDEQQQVLARRWCWRQSATSAAGAATTDALITIEAHHAGGAQAVPAATTELAALLTEFAGGTVRYAFLHAGQPVFD